MSKKIEFLFLSLFSVASLAQTKTQKGRFKPQHHSKKAPTNWTEVLHNTLTLNDKPKAKDQALEAQKERTKAARHGRLPTLSLSANASASTSNSKSSTNGLDFASRSHGGNMGVNVSASWLLFRCGYHSFVIKSAELREKIMEADFNSTQSFMRNTKGSVVANAFEAYSSVLFTNELLSVYEPVKRFLNLLAPIAQSDADATSALRNRMATIESGEKSFQRTRETAIEVFTHWVTLPPGDNIISLTEALDEMRIPENYRGAYTIAKQKSPDIKRARYQLELADIQVRIAQTIFCPQVMLHANYGFNLSNSHSRSDNFHTNSQGYGHSGSIGISVSVPIFDLPSRDEINAARKQFIADQLEQDIALKDTEFELKQTYSELAQQMETLRDQEAILKELEQDMHITEEDIANGRGLPDPLTSGAVSAYITAKLNMVSSYQSMHMQNSNIKSQILRNKFSVQKTMGTVFSDSAKH